MRKPSARVWARGSRVAPALSALGIASVLGCLDRSAMFESAPRGVLAQISDGAHNGGNPHFHFLPPLVAAPSLTGVVDASVAAFTAVEICEWAGSACVTPLLARFTPTSGPGSETVRLDTVAGHYVVNWQTDQFSLAANKTYRIRVLVAGAELGHADVDVVLAGSELRNVETGEYVALVDGRTLPIKFRIDAGAVSLVGPAGGTITAAGGAVALEIPAGAVPGVTGVTVGPASGVPADVGLVDGSSYALRPDSVRFAAPAVLTLRYDPARVPPGVPEAALRLHADAAGEGGGEEAWVEVFDSWVDPGAGAAAGTVDRLGVYGVLQRRPVDTVFVFPPAATVAAGDTLRLRATPADGRANALNRPVTWASTDQAAATVDDGGLVRGVASGLATITAASTEALGTAAITVRTPAYPHEPPGFTRLTERGFAAREEDGWRTTSSENFQIVDDSTAPQSPPAVGELVFPAGFLGADAPGWTELGDVSYLRYRRLYVSFWLRLSDNWQGHDSFANKVMYVWQHRNPVFFAHVFGKDDGPLTTRLGLQDIPIVIARNLEPNLVNVPILRGRWHRWEILLISNTGDNADGEAHWWIDGVKVGEYRDVTYRSALQSDLWEHITWYPVWGGAGDIATVTMFMWMDHFYASGAR